LDFNQGRGAQITFTYDGTSINGFENETIAAALHAAGIFTLSHSESGRPRGIYCAIGNCSSCMMVVDGEPNVKVCVELARDGMVVRTQETRGTLA